MLDDIGESLLRDTKEMSLQLQWQTSDLQPCFKFNVDAAPFLEVFNVPPQTSGEAEFIEYRRVESVRQCEDVFQTFLT